MFKFFVYFEYKIGFQVVTSFEEIIEFNEYIYDDDDFTLEVLRKIEEFDKYFTKKFFRDTRFAHCYLAYVVFEDLRSGELFHLYSPHNKYRDYYAYPVFISQQTCL